MQQPYQINNPYDAYKKQGILTANPIELIVMLFSGCKKNLLLAQRAILKKDYDTANSKLIKSQDIICELINCLDLSLPISAELLELYEFILISLRDINLKKDAQALEPIIEIVESLRETWQEVGASQKGTVQFEEENA